MTCFQLATAAPYGWKTQLVRNSYKLPRKPESCPFSCKVILYNCFVPGLSRSRARTGRSAPALSGVRAPASVRLRRNNDGRFCGSVRGVNRNENLAGVSRTIPPRTSLPSGRKAPGGSCSFFRAHSTCQRHRPALGGEENRRRFKDLARNSWFQSLGAREAVLKKVYDVSPV